MLKLAMLPVKAIPHKFAALDSLRGIAALMVIFQHFWEMNHPSDDRLRPWLFFCAGHEAVIFFFVLSGFVLSNQLRNFKFAEYGQFVLKRFFRIYPAYYVAIISSALLLIWIKAYFPSTLDGHGLTEWFYIWSQTAFDKTMLWGSLSIISHEGNSLDVVTWSLFYEVWLSLAFPLLLLAFWRWHWAINLLSGFLLILLSFYWWRTGDLLGNPWQSLVYYSWYFLLGLLLFRYHERIKFLANPWFLILGCGLYFSNYLLFGKISSRLLHEVIIALGSSLILLSGLHNKGFKWLLNWLPFRFYGKISYSLYLFHLPVLYALSYLLLAQHAVELVKIATLIITTLLAAMGYYWLELPSINAIKSILHKSSR